MEGDALALPFEDSSFDAVTMGYGLRNVVDIPQSLMEMRRVLKQGESPRKSREICLLWLSQHC